MHIMTKDGWKPLSPVCTNYIWERVSFNHLQKRWETDSQSGTLRITGSTDHAEASVKPFNETIYWQSVNRFCSEIRKAVKESQDRRAGY